MCQNLEDIVEEYFFYLVDRCFFQNMEMYTVKGVVTYSCQMHDLVHDLAKEVAGSESILVDQVNAQRPWDNKTLRHLSLVGHVCSVSHSKSLRTFLHFNRGSVGTNTLNELMSSFKVLRVLNLSRLGIKDISSSVGKLIHLRLLDLSGNGMERLPSSICSLHHLQSLILQYCEHLKELPEEIGKLISLRHLVVCGCSSLGEMPAGMAALTSLVTLDKRVVHKPGGELRYLECLDNLSGSLGIDICETGWENVTVDAQTACLSRKSRLKELRIKFESVESGGEVETLLGALEPHSKLEYLSIRKFGGNRMPLWVTWLDRLVILKLWRCENSIELAPLSRLPSLKELSVKYMSSMLSIEGSVSYDLELLLFFTSLEALLLEGMPKLRSWWVQAPTVLPKFPRVTKVRIKNCPELTAACMPLFALLVEDLELSGVQEEVFWQGIGIGSEASSLLGNSRSASALKSLQISSRLKKLTIQFNWGCADSLEVETLLGALEPHPNLEYLEIENFGGNRMPLWVMSLDRLVILRLDGCENSIELAPLSRLPSLKELSITDMSSMLSIEGSVSYDLEPLLFFPSLEALCLDEMPKLRSWWVQAPTVLPKFPRVTKVRIKNCPELTVAGMPLFALLVEDLELSGVQEEVVWQGIGIGNSRSTSALQRLSLSNIGGLRSIGEAQIRHLSATQSLQLSSTSPHKMTITGGSAEWLVDIPWKSFPSLRSLQLRRISNLEALPEGIQHLASLQTLEILECERVVSLPYWISSLSSLSLLHIWRCSEELRKRCQRVTGEDWPLIQQIQQVDIW